MHQKKRRKNIKDTSLSNARLFVKENYFFFFFEGSQAVSIL